MITIAVEKENVITQSSYADDVDRAGTACFDTLQLFKPIIQEQSACRLFFAYSDKISINITKMMHRILLLYTGTILVMLKYFKEKQAERGACQVVLHKWI